MRAAPVFSIAVLMLAGATPFATADTADAMCEVRKDGDDKKNMSGPCTFSQRQGYVDIDLRNGDTFSLRPTDKKDHFKDLKGNKVVLTIARDGSHEYKWDGKKITVRFDTHKGHGHGGHGDHASHEGGDKPQDVQDLVNGRRLGGEVDDALAKRGYTKVRDDVAGDDAWSYWRDRHDRCVVVHFDKRRSVKSIIYTPNVDCER